MDNFANGLQSFGIPLVGGLPVPRPGRKVLFVDGTYGNDGNYGTDPLKARKTIQSALNDCVVGDVVAVFPKVMAVTDTDPGSYAEVVSMAIPEVALLGLHRGRTQGGLPQIKKGSGSVAQLTVAAPGCIIGRMGINGGSATGGGILIDDDGSTKSVIGLTIIECHFKNCVGSTATDAATGGAIQWSANGGGWQVHILRNRFYKNVGDIVLKGTAQTVPQDVIIEQNVFSGPAASVDCNLYLAGGSGMNGVQILDNVFPCFPALGGGSNTKNLALTGCVGILAGNKFGCTGKTFGAAGNNLVPTTVLMAGNYQETAIGDNNYQSGHICRT